LPVELAGEGGIIPARYASPEVEGALKSSTPSSRGMTAANFSRYWRRFSSTCASSAQEAAEAAWTEGLMALPW